MPKSSVKNPNFKSKNRVKAQAAKSRQKNQKLAAEAKLGNDRVTKADTKRGARTGLLPTSGPNAPLSGKKRRKLEKKMGHALRRKMEEDGELVMKDAEDVEGAEEEEEQNDQAAVDEQMMADIS